MAKNRVRGAQNRNSWGGTRARRASEEGVGLA